MSALGVDTRSDIYSLGVLLYELLTGSTPVTHKRIKEAAYAEILRLIKEEEPPRPSTRLSDSGEALASISAQRHMEPAKLTKLLKGELDWIVMKTLEKDRNRRYETANAFAADVQRYLNDEPVQACPPSAGYRLRKFVRRNRTTVAAGAVLLTALVLGITGTTLGLFRARSAEAVALRERDKAVTAQAQERLALNEAEKNFRRAREAVDMMFTQVAEKWLGRNAHLEPVQRQFLQEAVRFYEDFAKERSSDPKVRLEKGNAFRRMGGIQWKLGQPSTAEDNFKQAIATLSDLAAEFPSEPAYQSALAEAHHVYGTVLSFINRQEEAEKASRRALAILGELAAKFPEVADYKRGLFYSYYQLGFDLSHLVGANRPAAEEAYRHALLIFDGLPRDLRDGPECRFVLGATLRELGNLLDSTGRPPEGEKLLYRAVTVQEKLTGEFPADPQHRNTLSWNLYYLANHLRNIRPEEAEKAYHRAIDIEEKLASESPMVPDYLANLVDYSTDLGILVKNVGRRAEAEQIFRHALDLFERLAADFPVWDFQNDPARFTRELASLLDEAGGAEEAGKIYRRLLHVNEERATHFPNVVFCQSQLFLYLDFANFLKARGQSQEAEQIYRQATHFFQKLVAANPKVGNHRDQLAQVYFGSRQWEKAIVELDQAIQLQPDRWESWYRRGEAYFYQQLWDKAQADLSKAVELNSQRATPWLLAAAWRLRAEIYVNQGQLDKGLAGFTSAIELSSGDWWCWISRARVYARLQQWSKAVADCTRAIELKSDWVEVWQTRGDAQAALGQWDKALADYAKVIELNPAAAPGLTAQLKAQGRMQEAEKLYRKFLELAPQNANGHNNLAWLLATCPEPKFRDPTRAVAEATRAVKLAPNAGTYWNTLGVAHYRAGDWKAAIAALEKSNELFKGNEMNFNAFFLAMAHWQLGKKDEARKSYDRAVQWMEKYQPKNEELVRFRAEAEELLKIEKKASPQ
jgi:tetratricopeptide (TPR) repeat protein